jgi:hypothetical protein
VVAANAVVVSRQATNEGTEEVKQKYSDRDAKLAADMDQFYRETKCAALLHWFEFKKWQRARKKKAHAKAE